MTQDQLPMVVIPSMNDTHLEEMLIVNRLDTAAKNSEVEEVREILKEFLEHTLEHFQGEEEMMQKARFPAYQTHKGEHDRHIHEIKALIRYYEEHRDPNAITAYIDGNLVRWLIHHIETMDTMTAKFLKSGKMTE